MTSLCRFQGFASALAIAAALSSLSFMPGVPNAQAAETLIETESESALYELADAAPAGISQAESARLPLSEQLSTRATEFGRVLHAPAGIPDPDRPFVRLAVNSFTLPNQNEAIIASTIAAFAKTFGANNFRAEIISDSVYASEPAIADFVLGSAGTYAKAAPIGARPLATISSGYFPNPNRGEGAVFAVRADSDIRSFEDMKGKRAVFLDPNAFSGYAVALGEIARRGEDPDEFFSAQRFANASMPREIDMLRAGEADVAVLRTCFLEELQARGIDVSDIRITAPRSDAAGDFRCVTSTALYPNWTLFSMPRATPEVARAAAAALLNMPEDRNGLRWSIASDFTPVNDLYRTIRLGPYQFLRTWTWERFWDTYRTEILCALALVLGLIVYAAGASRIIYRRTQALRRSLEEQKAQAERIREAHARIDAMQNAAAIAQMSHAIAHNLRQPLSAIINFAFGIRRLLDVDGPVSRDLVTEGIEKISRQAELAESIVQKVRRSGSKDAGAAFCSDIRIAAQRALQTLLASRSYPAEVKSRMAEVPLPLAIDPVEVELIVINLMKNALEAVEPLADGRAELSIEPAETEGGSASVEICVIDNGEPITDERLLELNDAPLTTKQDGMGLGIAIVRMIAEKHGGQVKFTRADDPAARAAAAQAGPRRGICARVTLLAKGSVPRRHEASLSSGGAS